MYLSKLEIIGFKSFAQKVNLTFDSGISAIVGPNGCGKTNIVDAIRWVLGEQRYSALRSEKMEDVIFNGTKTRKPLGMAEASLVIENTKGILPSEYSQVTIGRRVFRSGESEYLLNRVPCRLKDILDLFMDTGMGADAYSVIELKMVETILSDKADERRRLFEEAAGVTKYKHRRKAAYRKLESVQADLMRVNDIISEIQKAVNSLERQARKAEQFNEVNTRLKTLDIDLMEREYAHLFARMQPLEERLVGLTSDKEKIDVDLSREERQLDELRGQMTGIETRLTDARREVGFAAERIQRVEEKNLVATERLKALQDNITRAEAEKEELRAEQARLAALVVELQERNLLQKSEEEQLEGELEGKRLDLRELESRLEAKKAELQAFNDKTIALVHQIAEQQTAQDRMKGRVENLHGRSTHAAEESSAYEAEISRLDGDIEGLSTEDRQLRRAFTEAEMEYYNVETRKKDLKQRLDDLHHQEIELRNEVDRRKSRIDFLKGLIESREGLGEGARFLTSGKDWTPARLTTIADAVSAAEPHRRAIEAALGEHAGILIVESVRDAEEGMAILRREQRGKATFVCLDRVPEIRWREVVRNSAGVVGWAFDLATYDKPYAPLFRFLLDRILIVEDRATASRLVNSLPGITCITLEGEIATGVGIFRGGSARQDEGGMIGKRDQIDQLQKEIVDFESRLGGVGQEKAQLLTAHDAITLKEYLDRVKGIEKDMNAVEMRIAQLQFEKKRAGDIIAKNREEEVVLSRESEQLLAEIAAGEPLLSRLRDEKSDVERSIGASSHELEKLEADWNDRTANVTDLSMKLVALRGDQQTAATEMKHAQRTVEEIIATLSRRDAEVQHAENDILSVRAGMEENGAVLADLTEQRRGCEENRASVESESARVRDEIHRIELRIKDERRQHDDSMKATHELDLKIADLKAKADHLHARAQEEYELALDLKSYPDDEFVDFAALRDEIQGLRDKLKSLGNINFAAFEEYNSEKERFEFLTGQRKDLLEAEKTLLSTIEEINTTAQTKFLDTFAQIRLNFIETFKSLFDPGDECDLKLEEGVDPLEAKIEIVAKPRGKRPTSIELLSGGEKTLTATALLFAIYLVKPSPFCILDEVDAPLDDANVDRFTRILRKFSDNTQFIVVTHNKRTMEAANALYGVTMEEEGVSKLVTVRFNQGAEVRSAAVISG